MRPAEQPHFSAGQRAGRGRTVFDATDTARLGFEVDLFPAQVTDFGGAQAVAEGQENHERVAMAVAIVLRRVDQPFHFVDR